jgi:hypothetical protein
MFCMKAHQLSIVLPSKSRLVQLRMYTSYTKTCFFLGVTCYFSRMTYFWSFVLFRCYDFIRFLHAKHVFSNQFGWYLSFNCVITEKCVFFDNDPYITQNIVAILHLYHSRLVDLCFEIYQYHMYQFRLVIMCIETFQ